MTITDFFLKQTTKEIKNKFKEINLDKYYDFPENIKELCKTFRLENDKFCDNCYTIKRHSTAEVYMYFNLPNPLDEKHPMYFKVEYYVTSAKGGCSISLGLENHIELFEKVSTIFDNRIEYNNIEFRLWKQNLPEIFDEKKDEWDDNKKYYCLKKGLTPWDYYQALCKHAEEVKSLIDMFVTAAENGEFERTWNELKPHDKWERGHETFHAMYFPPVMYAYYRAVKAGATPNLKDFVILLSYSDKLGKNKMPDAEKIQEAFDKILGYNTTDDEVMQGFNYVINHFKEKHLIDDSLNKWCELYVEANKELLKEVNSIKQKLSKKYNINENWLRCVCLYRNEKDVKWDSDYIPDNAYAK